MSAVLAEGGESSNDDVLHADTGKIDSDEEGEASDEGEVEENGKEKDVEEGELEEGEVDDGEVGEAEEKKETCKFFLKGQCTWGSNCRFIHVSGTDKGNYNMFEDTNKKKEDLKPMKPRQRSPPVPPVLGALPGMKVRLPMVPPDLFPSIPEPPRRESAWERSARQARNLAQSAAKKRDAFDDNLRYGEMDVENVFSRGQERPIDQRLPLRPFPPMSRQEFEAMMSRDRRNMPQPPMGRMMDRRRESPPQIDARRNINARQRPDNFNRQRNQDDNRQRNLDDNRQRNPDDWQDPWMRSRSPPPRRRENWPRNNRPSGSPISRSPSRSPIRSEKISRDSRESRDKVRTPPTAVARRKPVRSPSASPISSRSSRSRSRSPVRVRSPVRSPARSDRSGKDSSFGRRRKRSLSPVHRREANRSPTLSNVSDSDEGPRTPPPDEESDEERRPQNGNSRVRERSSSPISADEDQGSPPPVSPQKSTDEPASKKQKKSHKPIKLTLQNKTDKVASASSAFRGYDEDEEDDQPRTPKAPESENPKANVPSTERLEDAPDPDAAEKRRLSEEKQQKREELLRQLRAVEEAIARKKATKAE